MDAFFAEIRMFGFNFAPQYWAFCNGQTMQISQNTALFSLLGTNYGGDGRSTFGLPNLQARLPVGVGQGPGLTRWTNGQVGGTETVTLLPTQMPGHTHGVAAANVAGTTTAASGNLLAVGTGGPPRTPNVARMYSSAAPNAQLPPQTLASAGGGAAHTNMMPSLALNFCIALTGTYPSRS